MKYLKIMVLGGSIVLSACNGLWKPQLGMDEALQQIDDYLQNRKLDWGKPTAVRQVENRYLYFFQTPTDELRSKGQRILRVEIPSGEVTQPVKGSIY